MNKLSLAKRVVDAQQTDRHYEEHDLVQLYNTTNIEPNVNPPEIIPPKDELLVKMIAMHSNILYKFHCHDSLLEEKVDEHLTEDERKLAWEEFEKEKMYEKNMSDPMTFSCLQIEPDTEIVDDIDIFGFTTTEILKLLTIKAQKDNPHDSVEQIPLLLSQLHNQMENGDTTVRFFFLPFRVIQINHLFSFLKFYLQLYTELVKIKSTLNE